MNDASPDKQDDNRLATRVFATVASGLVSALLHGSVLAAAFYWVDARPGAIEAPTDAISIELFQTEVLEVVATAPSPEATFSPSSVQSEAGEVSESAAATHVLRPVETIQQVEAKSLIVTEIDTLRGTEVVRGALESEEAAGVEQPRVKPASERSENTAREPKEKKKPVKAAKLTDPSGAESTPKKKGSTQSRAAKGSKGSAARVSASSGSAINYAALVRARVAARKPAGGGLRGTVVVAFGVTRSGGLSYVSVSRSSGDAGLDRSVLSAVRGAGPFPAPPPGANLRFAMPFTFR